MKSVYSAPGSATSTATSSQMSIFELLSWIVDQDPPGLASFAFSEQFVSLVDCCTQKNPKERSNLEMLLEMPFCQMYVMDDEEAGSTRILLGPYLTNILKAPSPP